MEVLYKIQSFKRIYYTVKIIFVLVKLNSQYFGQNKNSTQYFSNADKSTNQYFDGYMWPR